ncbi:hypothetical protein EDD29_3742 [Actinocorallia herbida]|uniref:DNA-binding protein n=1 Tax=Actinocorallia herbida TaxID=58109 RepID=A0A3N1CY10_9ACTN|nr:DNA-binding protein [Actinocorallia herbida]ROO86179.1 hypothetical protein EDD29_3742 [Actinocorallia herbida]
MGRSVGVEGVAELLEAGAYLHPEAADRGAGLPVTARAYRRPGLPGRTVVRLAPEETGEAEDAALAHFGLTRVGGAEVVGFAARARLGFPDWVLVYRPQDGHHAIALVPEVDRLSRLTTENAKRACEAFLRLGERVGAYAPHLLPTLYERAGREFLTARERDFAAQMFAEARKAESEHALPIDQDRADEVVLEFALAGALPYRGLSEFSKELALRLPPDEALSRFTGLLRRLASGGVPPAATTAADLRRLAKAATGNAARIERDHLAVMLGFPATLLAPEKWWRTHRTALAALAGERPEIRGLLLRTMPNRPDEEFLDLWLDLLAQTGAAALLADGAVDSGRPDDGAVHRPEEHRASSGAGPEDGVLGWLERFLVAAGWRGERRMERLESLVSGMAGRLRAELVARGVPLAVPQSVDLLDLLLELGIPVADALAPYQKLRLGHWVRQESRRDLVALCADPRFARALRVGLDVSPRDAPAPQMLAETPALRPHVLAYAEEKAARVGAAGLPGLGTALWRLAEVHPRALRSAEKAVRAALEVDLPDLLARTLRGGVFDELSWPAFEDAVATLFPEPVKPSGKIHPLPGTEGPVIAEEWPYLVVASRTRALVIDGSGVVLDQPLRLPDEAFHLGFRYVDGELLVQWCAQYRKEVSGYWHTRPADVVRLAGEHVNGDVLSEAARFQKISLEVPGGGRATGTAVIRRGDALAPGRAQFASDGRGYWARWYLKKRPVWYAFDPEKGTVGGRALPAFFAEPGEAFLGGFLAPFPGSGDTPVGAVLDGLVGHRMVRLPDGTVRGEDLAGTVSPAIAVDRDASDEGLLDALWPLRLPGDDRTRAVGAFGDVLRRAVPALFGPDGLLLAELSYPRTFAAGSSAVPPAHYWTYAVPRDPRGSVALRRVDRDLAVKLLDAGESSERVRELLPDITHPGLAAGVAGVVTAAARARTRITEEGRKIRHALTPVAPVAGSDAPKERVLLSALDGLYDGAYNPWAGRYPAAFADLLRKVGRLRTGAHPETADDSVLKVDPQSADLFSVVEGRAAIAFRAAAGVLPAEERTALRSVLGLLGDAGLAEPEPGGWRAHLLELTADNKRDHPLRLLPLDGGAFLAVAAQHRRKDGTRALTALFHDPSGRFEIPSTYEVLEELPAPDALPHAPVAKVLELLDAEGHLPWNPARAEEFARLTGVTPTIATLVVSGLLGHGAEDAPIPEETRKILRRTATELKVARADLPKMSRAARAEILGALLPADPARLWTDGPDVAAAAEVWNREVPRRLAVPEALLVEAEKDFERNSPTRERARALLDPASSPLLTVDLAHKIERWGVSVRGEGFTTKELRAAIGLLAWLAHRLPAGDPLRARLPAGFAAVRERLANPGLVQAEGYVDGPKFVRQAGPPDEEGEGWARYGAVLVLPHDHFHVAGVNVALMEADPDDPRLVLLESASRSRSQEAALRALRLALRTARDESFAALLEDPGDPVEGDRLPDGTWYPQDPSRSVPDLVAEVAAAHALSPDAAALYLMLLAMPDPTDRNTARWTGWKPARLKAARIELAATALVTEARRAKASRTLFLPGPWTESRSPKGLLEAWKHPLYPIAEAGETTLFPTLPTDPAPTLYRRAHHRITIGDLPGHDTPASPPPPTRP